MSAQRPGAAYLHTRRVLGSVLLGLLPVVGACGGGRDTAASDPASAASPSGAPAAADIDPCVLVTTQEASEALGAAAGAGERPREANYPPRMVTCRYTAPRGQGVAVMTVLVNRAETDSEARLGFQSARTQFPGAQVVPGLGDEAFYVGNQINALQGRVYLNITGDFDLPTARGVAERALQRLEP
jgi:hypothetical protein